MRKAPRQPVLLVSSVLIFVLAVGCGDPPPEARFGSFGEHFMAAKKALAAGDSAGAMEALNASIEAQPNPWAYLERAKIHLDQEKFDAAAADAKAGLELQPENQDLQWLVAELEKPSNARFKGRFASPPSTSK